MKGESAAAAGLALLWRSFAGSAGAAAPRPEEAPLCHGKRATIVGTDGNDVIHGTPGRDVIWGGGGDDVDLRRSSATT